MPQPKKSPPARGATGKAPAGGAPAGVRAGDAPAPDAGPGGLREQLNRLLTPLDAVLVTRDRLQEVVDDAVQRGRMTRSDATELMTEIFSLGRRTTEEWISELDQLLGGPGDRVRREVDRARRAAGLGAGFPIAGYESLSAAQVQSRLADLGPADLRKVRDYERRNANRKTVLAAIESRLG